MTALLAGAAGALAAGVPVVPDEQTARDWVETELRDPAYAEAQPSLLERVVGWVLDRLGSIDSGPSLWLWVVLAVVAAVVVLLVVRRNGLGGVRARTGGSAGEVGLDPTVSADEYRRRAAGAAVAQDWHAAVLEQFRAVVRSLEERTVLEPRPGRTADEASREAGALLPDRADQLAAAARVFDDVCYGDREATAEHHRLVAEVDTAVLGSRLAVGAA